MMKGDRLKQMIKNDNNSYRTNNGSEISEYGKINDRWQRSRVNSIVGLYGQVQDPNQTVIVTISFYLIVSNLKLGKW